MPEIEEQQQEEQTLGQQLEGSSEEDEGQEQGEEVENVESAEGEGEEAGDGEEESLVVSFGEDPPAEDPQESQPAPAWVKDLRKQHREAQKRIRELESMVQQGQAQPAAVQLGKKPTLEDFDYDTDKYETELANWFDRKRQVEKQEADARAEQEKAQRAWQEKLDRYSKDRSSIKVEDFDAAEFSVQEALDQAQQGILLHGVDNAALMVAALGKNKTVLKSLSEIKDPVLFAIRLGELKKEMTVTKQQRKAPPPEKTVRRSGSISGSVDSQLERLRSEAELTDDYSKVVAYRLQKRKS